MARLTTAERFVDLGFHLSEPRGTRRIGAEPRQAVGGVAGRDDICRSQGRNSGDERRDLGERQDIRAALGDGIVRLVELRGRAANQGQRQAEREVSGAAHWKAHHSAKATMPHTIRIPVTGFIGDAPYQLNTPI